MSYTPGPWEWRFTTPDLSGEYGAPDRYELQTVEGEWRPCSYGCQWDPRCSQHRGAQGTPGHEHWTPTARLDVEMPVDGPQPLDDDARLIAAAPEMAELLEEWIPDLYRVPDSLGFRTAALLSRVRGET